MYLVVLFTFLWMPVWSAINLSIEPEWNFYQKRHLVVEDFSILPQLERRLSTVVGDGRIYARDDYNIYLNSTFGNITIDEHYSWIVKFLHFGQVDLTDYFVFCFRCSTACSDDDIRFEKSFDGRNYNAMIIEFWELASKRRKYIMDNFVHNFEAHLFTHE